MKKFVSYLRVSTKHQGISGLGEHAQRNNIQNHIASNGGELLNEFVEVESGKNTNRPELNKAIEEAKATGATLIVSKLDRLGRKARHLFTIRDSGIDIVICDMPKIDTFSFGIFATMAEHEADIISKRTKEALRAKGYKGQVQNLTAEGRLMGSKAMKEKKAINGNNKRAKAFIKLLVESGASYSQCVQKLNESGFKTSRGNLFTSKTQVARLLAE